MPFRDSSSRCELSFSSRLEPYLEQSHEMPVADAQHAAEPVSLRFGLPIDCDGSRETLELRICAGEHAL